MNTWIKARDMGFYSIEYEYFKRGKDRIRASFNPDFFIKIDLDQYLKILDESGIESEQLRVLQDNGIETIIRVVEIKSDFDDNEATPAKRRYAEEHFAILNKRLFEGSTIPTEFLKENDSPHQLYIFDLLIPAQFEKWFERLRKGEMERIPEFLKGIHK
jgi:type III restriction enzyme